MAFPKFLMLSYASAMREDNCYQELYLLNEEKMEMFEQSATRSIPEGLNQNKWPKNKRIYMRLTNPKQVALGLSSV